MTYEERQHEEMRRNFWCRIYGEVANAFNCAKRDIARSWADGALKDFDAKFPKPIQGDDPICLPDAPVFTELQRIQSKLRMQRHKV